jgi:hypothetical protein
MSIDDLDSSVIAKVNSTARRAKADNSVIAIVALNYTQLANIFGSIQDFDQLVTEPFSFGCLYKCKINVNRIVPSSRSKYQFGYELFLLHYKNYYLGKRYYYNPYSYSEMQQVQI